MSRPIMTSMVAPEIGGSNKAEKAKHGRLRSINIEIAKQGFIGSCSFDPPENNKKDNYSCCYVPDERYALGDLEAVKGFVDAALGVAKEKAKS